MKNNIITDAKTALAIFWDMRKARRKGTGIKVCRSAQVVPLIDSSPSLIHTVEGHVLINRRDDIYGIAREAFNALPPEERRKVLNVPKDGEIVGRAHFWKNLLQPVMTPRQCHIAMDAILHWYIHIKRMGFVKGDAA